MIVPDLGRPRRVSGPPIVFAPDLGPALKDPDVTTGHDPLMAAENDEDMAELGRLLYVATTRGADYLILSSGVDDLAKPSGPWLEMLARRFDLATGDERERGTGVGGRENKIQNPKSKINQSANLSSPSPVPRPPSPCYVKVTTEEPPVQSKPVDPRRRRDLRQIIEKAQQMGRRRPRAVSQVPRPHRARPRRPTAIFLLASDGRTSCDDDAVETAVPETEKPALGPARPWHLGPCRVGGNRFIPARRRGATCKAIGRPALTNVRRQPRRANRNDPKIHVLSPRKANRHGRGTASGGGISVGLAAGRDRAPRGAVFQGFIDCLYLDAEGRWRLVDFKPTR